jgi:RNA polymerase sigma factor (sigma-70 family)
MLKKQEGKVLSQFESETENNPRIVTIGDPEELNSMIGVLVELEPTDEELAEVEETNFDSTPDADIHQLAGLPSSLNKKNQEGGTGRRLMRGGNGDGHDPVKIFLEEMGKTPLLSREEETELAKRIETAVLELGAINVFEEEAVIGTKTRLIMQKIDIARNRLTEANLRLVVNIAKKYTNRGLQFLDLIQEGNIGLMKAVKRFEYQRGCKFSTYATWWIRQSIIRALIDKSPTIRVPVHMAEAVRKTIKTIQFLEKSLSRKPTLEEIAEQMELAPEKVRRMLSIVRTVSIETPVGQEEDGRLGDSIIDETVLTPDEVSVNADLARQMRKVLSLLKPREELVLRLRFGIRDLGDDVSREAKKQLNKPKLPFVRVTKTHLRIIPIMHRHILPMSEEDFEVTEIGASRKEPETVLSAERKKRGRPFGPGKLNEAVKISEEILEQIYGNPTLNFIDFFCQLQQARQISWETMSRKVGGVSKLHFGQFIWAFKKNCRPYKLPVKSLEIACDGLGLKDNPESGHFWRTEFLKRYHDFRPNEKWRKEGIVRSEVNAQDILNETGLPFSALVKRLCRLKKVRVGDLAKAVGICPEYLSTLLNRPGVFDRGKAAIIANRLGLTDDERQQFMARSQQNN